MITRRVFNHTCLLAVPGIAVGAGAPPRNRIGVSTYSYWAFRNKEYRSIEKCIDLAAEQGFDGVEILQVQMELSLIHI